MLLAPEVVNRNVYAGLRPQYCATNIEAISGIPPRERVSRDHFQKEKTGRLQ